MVIEVNNIYTVECVAGMRQLPDKFVDLTVTSPPYDNLRAYNGFTWDFESTACELFRITKDGGTIVWVVNDATVNGSETGTSFSQAIRFKQLGFNLETMIWEKTGSGCLGSNKFYGQNFEFMFVLTKGFPKTSNLICDRENKVKSGAVKVNGGIDTSGKGKTRIVERKPFGKRTNIWRIDPQKNSNHPAPFPEQLANDHILTWSNPGDLVFDPFIGSGTTAKMAIANGRNFLGFDLSEEYCKLAKERINQYIIEAGLQDTHKLIA